MPYLKSHTPAPRLSGSIWILVSLFSLFLITACGGGGLSLDLNVSTPESRLLARCLANPFTDECNTPPIDITERSAGIIADAREGFITGCVKDATSDLCATATTFVCEGDAGNPFADLCQTDANEATYASDRAGTISTCIDPSGDLASDFCLNAIEVTCVDDAGRTANPVLCAGYANQDVVNTCDSNIWNSACDDSPTYIGQRRAHCTTNAADNRCAPVVSSVCTYDADDASNTGDPFNALCRTPANSATYETPRNDIITACTTNLLGRLCPNATTFICEINPFHALCYDPSATVFQTARQTAVTNCGDGTTTITEQVCADAVAETCEGDSPDTFNALCNAYSGQAAQMTACSDNDAATRCYLQEQIDACAQGDEVARCAQVGTGDISTCTADPFAAACVADGSTFAPYLSDAQAKRYDYCGAEGVSDTDPICTSYRACDTALSGGTTVPAGCGVNFDADLTQICAATPFDPQCARDIFNDNKQAFCMINTGGVNNLFHANCTAEYRDDTARDTFCEGNPFDTNCESIADYADEREANCAGGTPNAKCVRPGLNAAAHPVDIPTNNMQSKFRDSFLSSVTLNNDGTLATIKGIATITEMMDDPNAEPDADPVPQITSTRTEDRTATVTGNIIIGRRGGAGTDEDPNTNPDGYAIFKLVRQGVVAEAMRTSQHSAILSTTNLGAPLTTAPTIAIWPGHFITGNNTTTIAPTPIAVDFYIDFVGKKIGFINTARDGIGADRGTGNVDDRPAAARAPGIHLGATFNAAGIMGGFVSLDDLRGNNALNVFGLIGQEGFVATFTDVNNQTGKFGGITASNPSHPDYVAPVVESGVVEDRATDTQTNKVNYQDWVGSFAPKTALSSPRESEILQTQTTSEGRRLSGLTTGANTKARDFSNHNFFRTRLLKGDAKNGLVLRAHEGNYYAGILHTADLGAPITTTTGEAVWRAFLFVQDTPTGGEIRKAFDLDIIFASGDITGGVRDDIKNAASARIFDINGKFDTQGVITGTITRTATQIIAPISGIIGQDGAIAVFASNVADNKFAGGFIALPHQVQDVTYGGVWTATHGAGRDGLFVVPQTYNHWLHGDARSASGNVVNGQSTLGITKHNGGLLTLANSSWKAASLGGDATDGVAYYTGVRTNTGRRFYSGLTSTTDLGKPVTRKSGSVKWYGQMSTRQNNGRAIVANYGDITLTINFSGTGGTITGDLLKNKVKSPGYRYEIRGWFNEDGFVDGNVNTVSGASNQFRETGFLSGLIGEQGVVGAFIAPNVAGGFVATPRKPRNVEVTYADFLHYAQSQGEAITTVPHNEANRFNEILLTSPTAPYNVSYGHIRTDDGAYTGSVTVDAVFGADTKPAGLTGGYSHLYGVWNESNRLGQNESNLQRAYHAGLHPNTNVGPHLVTRTSNITLNFKARISIRGSRTFKYGNLSPVYTDNAEFRMSLNLRPDIKRISSPDSQASRNPIGGTFHSLEATWDDRGVMTGTIENNHADFPDGRIIGLIGQYGAVAVIISDYNRHYGYSGGLVACATVKNDGRGACIP